MDGCGHAAGWPSSFALHDGAAQIFVAAACTASAAGTLALDQRQVGG
jgi:hypothetical protein